jgi:hypothetical protein
MKTAVDRALIRGLVTAGPVMLRGASSDYGYEGSPGRDRISSLA